MEYVKTLYKLSGPALDELARGLYERDVRAFEEVIVELVKLGKMRDYVTAAAMLATVPMIAQSTSSDYGDVRFGTLVSDRYFNMFLRACADCGYGENEYMKVLLAAQYADPNTAFFGWDKSVDRYVSALATADFDRAADYIERYDARYGKYGVLIRVDCDRALNRLLALALYGKGIDKAAVRDVLMDYWEVADVLMAMYGKVSAHERVAVVRLLLAFKNDGRVKQFLSEVVANDKSKSVRDAAFKNVRNAKNKTAAKRLAAMMADGAGLTYSEWVAQLTDTEYAAVADKVFFCMQRGDGHVSVLVYNDGQFLDSSDRPILPEHDEKIYVLHPLDLTGDDTAILALDIEQPFLQIKRPIFAKVPGERYGSMRLSGTMIARDRFEANFKKTGFAFCDKRSPSEPTVAMCRRGEYAVCIECDMPESSYTVSGGRITVYRAADVVKLKRKQYVSTADPCDLMQLEPRIYSELMYLPYRLFSDAE